MGVSQLQVRYTAASLIARADRVLYDGWGRRRFEASTEGDTAPIRRPT